MISDGILILFVGVGTVLVFFTTMIFVMKLIEKVVAFLNKKFPEKPQNGEGQKPNMQLGADKTDNVHIAIAIAAAKRFQGK